MYSCRTNGIIPAPMNAAVTYERGADHVGVLTLNRPDEKNTMSAELLAAFAERVDEARADTLLRCLVVTGQGRAFCAGADLSNPVQTDEPGRSGQERSYAMYEPFLSLVDVEVPVVGALNGHAIGGGLGLALLCDLRYARKDAKYGATFTRLGLHPGMAVTYILPRLVGVAHASDWLYTGRLFDGNEGASAGLFNEALPGEEVIPRAIEVARQIAANGPLAVKLTKMSLLQGLAWNRRAAAWDEASAQAITVETDDGREGIDAALARRDPRFAGR